MTHSTLTYALLLTALTACGGKSFDSDPNPSDGGSDVGGSGQGGSGSAGKSQGGTSQGGSVNYAGMGPGGAGGSGSVCDGFNDAQGTYISVEIINKTSTVIYLGQQELNCGVSPLFGVSDAAGAALSPPSGCQGTCQTLRDHGPIGCPAICAFPSSTAIQPGQSLYTTWSGLYQVERELPRQCVDADYGNVCQQTVQVRPGQFTFSAIAGRSIDCSLSSGGPCQACQPIEDACVTQGALISGQILKAATTLALDSSYGVYGGAMPGVGGFVNLPRENVEIIFSE